MSNCMKMVQCFKLILVQNPLLQTDMLCWNLSVELILDISCYLMSKEILYVPLSTLI